MYKFKCIFFPNIVLSEKNQWYKSHFSQTLQEKKLGHVHVVQRGEETGNPSSPASVYEVHLPNLTSQAYYQFCEEFIA